MKNINLGKTKNKKTSDLFWLCPILAWVALFLAATNVAMIFSGDSIEYLEMANQLNKGQFPKSNMWMPLYPIMIWLTAKLFFVDFLTGVKLYHLILTTFFIFVYNRYFVMKQSLNLLDRLILNTPIFCYFIFIEELITIMAECQFLILTLINLYIIKLFLEKKSIKYIYWAIIFTTLSILTKLNGFVNLGLLLIMITYTFSITKALKYSILSILTVGSIYMVWLNYKPGGDFLVGAVHRRTFDFFEVFTKNSADVIYSFSKYFLPFRLNEIFRNFIGVKVAALFFNITFLFVFIIVVYKYFVRKLSFKDLLVLYCVIYLILLFARYTPSGITEINTRTLFYVLFIATYLVSYAIVKLRSLWLSGILLTIPFISLIKVVGSVPNIINYGIGPSVNPAYQEKSTLMSSIRSLRDSMGIEVNQIYSNEHKVLTLFMNYYRVSALPMSKVLTGNGYVVNKDYKTDLRKFINRISDDKFLIVYVKLPLTHPRYDSAWSAQIISLCKDKNYGFIEDEFSYLLWSKK